MRCARPARSSCGPAATPGADWATLPAAARAKVIARAMLGNMGEVEVDEDDEKIMLCFRCGSGGKLIDDGRYDGEHAYLHAARAVPAARSCATSSGCTARTAP